MQYISFNLSYLLNRRAVEERNGKGYAIKHGELREDQKSRLFATKCFSNHQGVSVSPSSHFPRSHVTTLSLLTSIDGYIRVRICC